ncbi:hypothetical protein PLICRDRAFT_179307 [Plicaturopsis crispa FD-325 SS-3]|uniref:DUF6532 domain-containing protein n=1 Tax=Plicaturopsis crispa FD-325 SS-3 TaxID=944288 RepID=A0A0C9SKX2_PLICR|nr:hypothetical protein PLICRDRAFT_179307 [Plicaturopsis crispa FD-325 SS-3]
MCEIVGILERRSRDEASTIGLKERSCPTWASQSAPSGHAGSSAPAEPQDVKRRQSKKHVRKHAVPSDEESLDKSKAERDLGSANKQSGECSTPDASLTRNVTQSTGPHVSNGQPDPGGQRQGPLTDSENHQGTSSHKAQGRRAQKRDDENPKFRSNRNASTIPDQESTPSQDAQDSTGVDADAEIDLIFTDGRFNMTAQRAPVNDVLEIALVHIYGAILFEESWLDVTQSIGFSRRAVVSAAAEAVEKDTVFQRIQHRLQSDRRYMKTLSNYIKGLTPNDTNGCIERLMMNQRYIYAGDIQQKIDKEMAYRHPYIAQLLGQAYFHGRSPNAVTLQDWFDAHTVNDRYEIPLPMLALTATAIYASLDWWKRGCPETKPQFSNALYSSIYRVHVYVLSQLRDDRPQVYRKLVTDLFDEASSGMPGPSSHGTAEDDLKSAAADILADMDVVNMPDGLDE